MRGAGSWRSEHSLLGWQWQELLFTDACCCLLACTAGRYQVNLNGHCKAAPVFQGSGTVPHGLCCAHMQPPYALFMSWGCNTQYTNKARGGCICVRRHNHSHPTGCPASEHTFHSPHPFAPPCSRGRTLTPVYTITSSPTSEEGPCFTARLFLPANTGLPPDVELVGRGSTKSGAAKAAALMALRLLLKLGKLDGRLQPTWVSAKHIRSLGEARPGVWGVAGGEAGPLRSGRMCLN